MISPFPFLFCLKCNIKTEHTVKLYSHFVDSRFACVVCGTIFDNIPCISQITIEQYIKDKQLKKEHDKVVDDVMWKGMQEVKKQIALAERHEKNVLNGGDRSVWRRITQLFRRI